jgi:hypothetical protein
MVLGILGLLEVISLSWVLASNIPHRSADVEAFMRYQSAPTTENKELWLKERQRTQNEITVRRYLGGCLALGNALLIGCVARRRTGSPVSD